MGKSFDQSAPCGLITPAGQAGDMTRGSISVTVNGLARQKSDLSLLIWSVAEVIADLSCYGELKSGDLIYTGTPEGVGPVGPGDVLVGRIDGLTDLTITIDR
jgi:fumarylpyruvate hydrolase